MNFWKAWGRYEIPSLAAAVAFYAAVSLFPLAMVLIAGVGFLFRFVESGKDARAQVLSFLSNQFSPEMSQSLAQVLDRVQAKAMVNGPVAALGFFFVASLAFAQIDKGFLRIWDANDKRKTGVVGAMSWAFFLRLRSFGLMAGMLVAVLFVFAGSTVWQVLEEQSAVWVPFDLPEWGIGSYLFTILMNTLVLSVAYHFLAKSKVKWVNCLLAGLIAAVFWEFGRQALARVIIGDRYSDYGIVGSFLVVLLWIYYNVIVLFSGALWLKLRSRG